MDNNQTMRLQCLRLGNQINNYIIVARKVADKVHILDLTNILKGQSRSEEWHRWAVTHSTRCQV